MAEMARLPVRRSNGAIRRLDALEMFTAYYRAERTFGSFYRRLPLPFEVEPEQVQASITDGVPEVRIPRPAQNQSEPKKIPVT